MRPIVRTAFYWLMDWICPVAQPLSPQERRTIEGKRSAAQREWENRTAALQAEEASLRQYLALCKTALEEERQRQQSVDSRLTTIIGFSSIAATIVFGTILNGTPRRSGILSWLILLSLGYLTLQLANAIWAGIHGLDRRAYEALPLTDMLPSGGEAQTDYVRHQIQQYHAVLVQHQEQNNAKVTQMARAYRAIKNFVAGLLVLAVLAGTHHFVTPP